MMKELFLAIILGALLGLGVTGGFFALNKNHNVSTAQNITPTSVPIDNQNISPTPIRTNINGNLVISTPKDNVVVNADKLTISGVTAPQNIIVVTTASKTYNTTAASTGNFSVDIILDSGLNQVKVTSINSQDEVNEALLNITYSTAKI
jgi:hypothetical protein